MPTLALRATHLPEGSAARICLDFAERLTAVNGPRRALIAAVLGAASVLALPPFHAMPVLLVTLPCLIWLLDGASATTRPNRAAFWTGWCFGFGYFVVGLHWIASALFVDLASFWWLVPFAVAGLPAGLAIFFGLIALIHGAVARWAALDAVERAMLFAVVWTGVEVTRGVVLTGFPWNLIGYTWVGWPPVLQAASLIGVHGLGLITVLTAGLAYAVIDRDRFRFSSRATAVFGAMVVVLAAMAFWGSVRLTAPLETHPDLRLRLVQASVPQDQKWHPDHRLLHFNRHLDLSVAPGAGPPPTHVIWPETAAPFLLNRDAEARRRIAAVVPDGSVLLTGSPLGDPVAGAPDQVRFTNSLVGIDGDGVLTLRYDKVHLVPFGEYVPFGSVLPIEKITEGREDFTPGPGLRTLAAGTAARADAPALPPFSVLICYEAIFPGHVALTGPDRPAWLLNVTNDAWFGETIGPQQHYAQARMRAVEEGLPLVRAANTGISAVTDGYGRVLDRLDLGAVGVIDAPLPTALTPTVFARFGHGPLAILTLLLVTLIIISRTLRNR